MGQLREPRSKRESRWRNSGSKVIPLTTSPDITSPSNLHGSPSILQHRVHCMVLHHERLLCARESSTHSFEEESKCESAHSWKTVTGYPSRRREQIKRVPVRVIRRDLESCHSPGFVGERKLLWTSSLLFLKEEGTQGRNTLPPWGKCKPLLDRSLLKIRIARRNTPLHTTHIPRQSHTEHREML